MFESAKRSFYRVYRKAVSDALHVQLGYAVGILCATHRAGGRQLRFCEHILTPAIMHKQMALFFDEDGEAAAYVLWAALTPEVEQRVLRTKRLGLHFSEWDEGERIWIVDLAARPGYLKHVLQYCRDSLFRDHDEVKYMRFRDPAPRPKYPPGEHARLPVSISAAGLRLRLWPRKLPLSYPRLNLLAWRSTGIDKEKRALNTQNITISIPEISRQSHQISHRHIRSLVPVACLNFLAKTKAYFSPILTEFGVMNVLRHVKNFFTQC